MPDNKRLSKLLSYILRHRPDEYGVELDEAGWVDVSVLLEALAARGKAASREQLWSVVKNSDKQRFAFNEDGSRIRANQGHSVDVELGYNPAEPPTVLFHGTVEKFLESIRTSGLLRGERHHVHLSPDKVTASKVGQRRGRPVILQVDAAAMHADEHAFFVSDNGVWLTAHVPPRYIRFP